MVLCVFINLVENTFLCLFCTFCGSLGILVVLLTEYCAGGKIKKNEMGRACDAYGGGERGAQGSGGET